jgi:DNA-binding GntR family transcriptional regulator
MSGRQKEPKDLTAYHDIRDMMFNRRLITGQKIVSRDLEEQFQMSKTPIMMALARLEQDGLVISSHNRGYFVMSWNKTEIEQLVEMREKLQSILIGYAVPRYKEEELTALKEVLDEYLAYNSAVYDRHLWALDSAFHRQIARMSENKFMVNTLRRLNDILYIAIDITVLTPFIKKLKKEHIAIFQSIEARDIQKAKDSLMKHDHNALKIMVDSIIV